jgi:hypothetical protein
VLERTRVGGDGIKGTFRSWRNVERIAIEMLRLLVDDCPRSTMSVPLLLSAPDRTRDVDAVINGLCRNGNAPTRATAWSRRLVQYPVVLIWACTLCRATQTEVEGHPRRFATRIEKCAHVAAKHAVAGPRQPRSMITSAPAALGNTPQNSHPGVDEFLLIGHLFGMFQMEYSRKEPDVGAERNVAGLLVAWLIVLAYCFVVAFAPAILASLDLQQVDVIVTDNQGR